MLRVCILIIQNVGFIVVMTVNRSYTCFEVGRRGNRHSSSTERKRNDPFGYRLQRIKLKLELLFTNYVYIGRL